MRRLLGLLFAGGLLLLGSLPLTTSAAAATLAAATTCSNGVDNTGGLGLICNVIVVNTITASGGTAVVTVQECHGAAGAPSAACTTTTDSLTGPVTVVNQCNNSINGGGGTLRCSVQITNDFGGVSPGATGATVNQCVGSGGGITTGCNPFPATTSGAAITQCNGSANGGTLVGMTCTATGTMAAAAGVTVNQCNGSANGGRPHRRGREACHPLWLSDRVEPPGGASAPTADGTIYVGLWARLFAPDGTASYSTFVRVARTMSASCSSFPCIHARTGGMLRFSVNSQGRDMATVGPQECRVGET